MKTCIHCNKEKHEQSFHVSGNGKRGNVCHACKNKRYLASNPEYKKRSNRRKHLRESYDMSISDYQLLHDAQSGLCAICNLELKLYVDHCHDTGKIRGLICNKCNSAMGFLNDNPELLKKAYEYLVRGLEVANP